MWFLSVCACVRARACVRVVRPPVHTPCPPPRTHARTYTHTHGTRHTHAQVRDINAGRYGRDTSLVLVTHGLALRVFLMRWLHWTVEQLLAVYNPPNAEPLVLERMVPDQLERIGAWAHTKARACV